MLGGMVFVLGVGGLVLTLIGFVLELDEEDPEELDRSAWESWLAMRPSRKFELLSMFCVAGGLAASAL